jgi:hypothetical protein
MPSRLLAVETVALNVMPRETARVTEKGIKFKGGYYTCQTERNETWRFRARTKKTWTEEVCFDPRSLEKMYLLKAALPGGFEACELMRPSQELSDVSLFEYEEVARAGKVVSAEGEEHRRKRRINLIVLFRRAQKSGSDTIPELDGAGLILRVP